MAKVISCWLALSLALPSTSAIRRLNSINDLKAIDFGQSVPLHSLLLLHWFAHAINIDTNGVISLMFDPNCEDYGSHYYNNYERLLPHRNYYYTLGNINQGTSSTLHLPGYVIYPQAKYNGRNRDRIIIEATHHWLFPTGYNIHRVYITQHFLNTMAGEYDADHTYEITPNLLRQIRGFSTASLLVTEVQNRSRFHGLQSASYTSTNSYGNYSANRQNNWDCDCLTTCAAGFFCLIIVCAVLFFILVNSPQFKSRNMY